MNNLKNITIKYAPVLIVITILFACQQKEVVIPQQAYDSKLSIQGIVEPDSFPIVYLNRTVPFLTGSTNTTNLLVRDAIVIISSSLESDILSLDSVNNKVDCRYDYFYKGNIKTKFNTDYMLEVTTGSKTYTATATTNLKAVTIDSTSYTDAFKDLYGEHEGVIVYFKDIPSEVDFYRYEMYRTVDSTVTRGEKTLYGSCLANETVMFRELGRSVYNDKNLESQQIKMVIEPALSHFAGLTGKIRIQTIDQATYDFYDQTDRQKLGVYNPFVEPVYLKEGQFGPDVYGFFGARTRSEEILFTYPE